MSEEEWLRSENARLEKLAASSKSEDSCGHETEIAQLYQRVRDLEMENTRLREKLNPPQPFVGQASGRE